MRPESLDVEDARSLAARVLAPATLDKAWAQGRVMSLDEAVDQAHQLGELVSADPHRHGSERGGHVRG